MKGTGIGIFFMLCTAMAFSQKKSVYISDSAYLRQVKRISFTLKDETSPHVLQLPFTHITIADVRFDTSQVALYNYPKNSMMAVHAYLVNEKINTDSTTTASLSRYFNNYYKNSFSKSGNAELLFFLKALTCHKKDTLMDDVYLESTFGEVTIRAEVFLHKNDAYYAAFKIDTTIKNWVPCCQETIC